MSAGLDIEIPNELLKWPEARCINTVWMCVGFVLFCFFVFLFFLISFYSLGFIVSLWISIEYAFKIREKLSNTLNGKRRWRTIFFLSIWFSSCPIKPRFPLFKVLYYYSSLPCESKLQNVKNATYEVKKWIKEKKAVETLRLRLIAVVASLNKVDLFILFVFSSLIPLFKCIMWDRLHSFEFMG